MGTTKTIKSLEKAKRDREQEIKLLHLELDKKDRLIDSLKSENIDPNTRHKKNNSFNASSLLQQRKRERDLESKLREVEATMAEERKHMSRLQQLNTQLLSKIKGKSTADRMSEEESNNLNQLIKSLKSDNSNLRYDKRQILDEYKDLKEKFDQLIEENSEMAQKYDSLLKNSITLYQSHQELTEKLKRHLQK